MIYSIEEAQEKLLGVKSDVSSDIAASLARKSVGKNDKIEDATTKDRLMWAALSGLASMAVTAAAPRLIGRLMGKRLRIPLSVQAATALTASTTGYFSPDVRNTLIEERSGKISRKDAKKTIREYGRLSSKIDDSTKDVAEVMRNPLGKEASLFSAGKGLGTGVGKFIGQSVGFGGKPQLGEKIWRGAVKTGIVGGTIYGGYKIHQNVSNRSKANYTTFLRNQLLAGNIKPNELRPKNIEEVRRLGMR